VPEMRGYLPKIEDYPAYLEQAWQQHLAPRQPDAPTVISLFAGCGGSSLGYSMAGYRELLAVDWDKKAIATFRLNFSDVSVWEGDICQLTADEAMQIAGVKPGELDVLDGSPPCQGFSTTGKRDFRDKRNQLFREYVRLLRALKPKMFIMENVSGLIQGKMRMIFAEIMSELRASDYQVSCKLLNAMYFATPQNRKRLIWIGIRDDLQIVSSHVQAQTAPVGCKRLDERNARYSQYRYGDRLVREGWPLHTLATISRYFWDANHELGRCSYAYAASYPKEFIFPPALSIAKRLIGNSVPPLFMRAIALHVRRLLASQIE